MSSASNCFWCVRWFFNGAVVHAGIFRLRDAVDFGLDVLASLERDYGCGNGATTLTIEPWFPSAEDEFEWMGKHYVS